jgi:hypothetical protein
MTSYPEGTPQPPTYDPYAPENGHQSVPETAPIDAAPAAPQAPVTWEDVREAAQDAAGMVLDAYGARKGEKNSHLTSREYDENGNLLGMSEGERTLSQITPDTVIVGLMRGERSWARVKKALAGKHKVRDLVTAAKSIFPDFIEEVPSVVGWTVARNEYSGTENDSKKEADPADKDKDEDDQDDVLDRYVTRYAAQQEQQENDDPEEKDLSPKTVERIIMTSDGELIRAICEDDSAGDSLRLARPVYKKSARNKNALDAEMAALEAYRERNKSKFTRIVGKLSLVSTIDDAKNLVATPDEAYTSITRRWDATGTRMVKTKD